MELVIYRATYATVGGLLAYAHFTGGPTIW